MVRKLHLGFLVLLTAGGLSQASAATLQHMVTGSGEAETEGVVFRTTVAAHSDSDGRVWGVVAVTVDLSVFDLGQITFTGPVTCLSVVGNSAWIGSLVKTSTNPDVIPAGLGAITLVRDLGPEGTDIMHGELEDAFPPGTTCADHPALSESIVTSGDYKVQ